MTEHATETGTLLSRCSHPSEQADNTLPAAARSPNLRPKSTLVRRPTKGPIPKPVDHTSLLCGLIAGVAQAGVFNPYDRALYLSIKDSRPFLSRVNWTSPYTGFVQSLGGRALAGGLYFPCEHFYLHWLNAEESLPTSNFLAGTFAGLTCAFIMNPLTAIRYKTWGRETNRGIVKEARDMLINSGYSLRPFFNGLNATLWRDAVFGGCYTTIRLQLQWIFDLDAHNQWEANFVASGLAAIVSGPWNYARNLQYATRSKEFQPSIRSVFIDLVKDVQQQKDFIDKLKFLQVQLRIGWGTLRVAMGMAFAHSVYDGLHASINKRA